MTISLPKYDESRGPDWIMDHFTLSKGDRSARCSVSTHPLGWEVRLVGASTDGFERTQVCKTPDQVFDLGDEWRSKLGSNGWE